MASIPIISIAPAAQISPVAATPSGDQYENNGTHLLFVYNDGLSSQNVTRLKQTDPPDPDICVDIIAACPSGSLTILPPLTPRRFNDALGNVQVRYPNGGVSMRVIVVRATAAL